MLVRVLLIYACSLAVEQIAYIDKVVGSNPTRRTMVDVAQLAERQIVILIVAGSNPVIHPQFAPVAQLAEQSPDTAKVASSNLAGCTG